MGDAPDPRLVALIEATTGALTQRLKNCETTDETLAVALAQRLDTLTGRVSELESTHATRGVWVRQELDALTASVGVLRADLVSLQAQRDPWPVMLARLESLSDERNAARRDLMRVAKRAADAREELARTQRDARQNFLLYTQQQEVLRKDLEERAQEAALYRALLARVRSGDLVRCLTCEGRGRCADCEDERGAPRYGVPGLVPPEANEALTLRGDGE